PRPNVRFGSKADISVKNLMSALPSKADMCGLLWPIADIVLLIRSPRRRASLLRWRNERFPFFNDINHVQFDGLISRAFVVNGAVGKCLGLPRAQNLFRLAVKVQPEVTLYDMCHDHARMVMAPGFETGGDFYCRVDDLEISSGYVRSLQDRAFNGRGLNR